MAQSPAHRFGQIVGEVLEEAIFPLLQQFADEHSLFLDKKGPRPCRRGKKCTWVDKNNNTHDLDFVLEKGGTPDDVGTPVAFIETAWRRYTKHSRNKAQEIQGAIEPLAETFQTSCPFKGAILAGVFTEGALTQLRSLRFTLLYFPYDQVVTIFRRFGIDASSEEDTPVKEFSEKVAAYESLTVKQRKKLAASFVAVYKNEVNVFMESLSKAILRQIERIIVIALHGMLREVETVDDAIKFIDAYKRSSKGFTVERIEIEIRYNNGNKISGSFLDKVGAIEFLKTYQPISPHIL